MEVMSSGVPESSLYSEYQGSDLERRIMKLELLIRNEISLVKQSIAKLSIRFATVERVLKQDNSCGLENSHHQTYRLKSSYSRDKTYPIQNVALQNPTIQEVSLSQSRLNTSKDVNEVCASDHAENIGEGGENVQEAYRVQLSEADRIQNNGQLNYLNPADDSSRESNAEALVRNSTSVPFGENIIVRKKNATPYIKDPNDPNRRGCTICGKWLSGTQVRRTLRAHMELHSTVAKYSCNYCGRRFKQDRVRRSHVIRFHERDKKHKCKYCDKTFLTTQEKKNHEPKHLKRNRIICEECGKAFTDEKGYKLHQTRHTSIKIPCGVEGCKKTFSHETMRRRHIKKVHETVKLIGPDGRPLKQFFCHIDGLGFTDKSKLSRHMKVKHPEEQIHPKTDIEIIASDFANIPMYSVVSSEPCGDRNSSVLTLEGNGSSN